MRRFLSNLLLLTISLIFVFSLGEIGLRLFYPQMLDLKIKQDWKERDEELGYVPRKNARSRMFHSRAYDVAIHTNSLGLRGSKDYFLAKSVDSARILFVGDSFVFGWGLEDNETVPAHLERELEMKNIKAEVMNAGVYGYDTSHYVAWNKRFFDHQPDVTVLGFCLENDFSIDPLPFEIKGDKAAVKPGEVKNPFAVNRFYFYIKQNILLKSHLLRLIRESLYLYVPDIRSFFLRLGLNDKRNIFLKNYPFSLRADLEKVEANLIQLKNAVEKNGGRFLVVAIPLREQIYSPDAINQFAGFDVFKPNQMLKEICDRNHISLFDPTPQFLSESKAGHQKFYFDTDPHFSVAGSRFMAKIIADELIRKYSDWLLSRQEPVN